MKNHGNQSKTMKNHETTLKKHGNQPKTIKTQLDHENQPGTLKNLKNRPRTLKTDLELYRVVMGGSGDSQEEVIIFRDTQTDTSS